MHHLINQPIHENIQYSILTLQLPLLLRKILTLEICNLVTHSPESTTDCVHEIITLAIRAQYSFTFPLTSLSNFWKLRLFWGGGRF